MLGKVGEVNESIKVEEKLDSASTFKSIEEIVEVVPTKSRPHRYVVSDSESEIANDDSDFEDEEED